MRLTFTGTEDFGAYNAAQMWLEEHGYSYGPLQADAPTGIAKGDCEISKWRTLTDQERDDLDGTMNAPGRTYRTGPVYIDLKESKP